MSLVVVGGASAAGFFLYWRRGEFSARAAALFAGGGILGSFFGATLTHTVAPQTLLLLFGLLMLVIGALMLRSPAPAAPTSFHPLRAIVAGLAVGVLTGFLGVGGGMLILPALVLCTGLDMKTAIGTSLAVIFLNCAAGVAGQLIHVSLDWPLTLGFLLMAVAGMIGGQPLAARLSSQDLRRIFAWAIIVLGLLLLAGNR
jgi:hypothetical protein